MKLLSATLLLLAAPLAAALAFDEEPSREAFMAKFRQANQIGDTSEMSKLIKANQQFAVESIMWTAEAISNGPNEDLEKEMSGFRKGWKQAFGTGFVDEVYEYFSLMKPNIKRDRKALKVDFDKQAIAFVEAEAAEDKNAFAGIGVELAAIGEGFVEMGDHYYASQSFWFAALSFDENHRGADADLGREFKYYKLSFESRDAVELKDTAYAQIKQRYEVLEAEGWGEATEDGEGGMTPAAPVEGAMVTAAMAFSLLDDPTDVPRPIYNGDEVYPSWQGVYLKGRGSSSKFNAFENKVPLVIREGASEILVDQDGDGTGDVPIPLKGKVLPVEVEIGTGAAKRKWAFFTMTGGQRDYYQGIQLNLEPTDDQMTIYVNPAGSMGGELAATPVRVFDDNFDGIYGSPAKSWAHTGTTEGVFAVEVDSILVGKEKRARPWSEYQQLGDQWYRVESLDGGTSLQATEVELRTGTLKLKTKGAKPDYVIVQGTGEILENAYFDLMQNGSKGIEVPVGKYELAVGFVQTGKRMDVQKTLMLKGEGTKYWSVKEGEETVVELGAPYDFDFEVVEGDDSVKVIGSSVVVIGASGERYERTWGAVPKPDVSVRKAGAKRGSKGESMKVMGSQDDLNNYGWDASWFPLDLEVPKPAGAEDGVEVQLLQKKHDLFGKIESTWRG